MQPLSRSCLCLFNDLLESGDILDGKIRENFPIEDDPRGLQAFDEAAVSNPSARTAAFSRVIQSERKVRLRVLRSR